MDFSQFAMAGFVLIGLVNGIGFAIDRQWKSFGLFLTATIAGAVFGYLGWFGLGTIEIGLAVGISSSGAYKIAQKIGGN